jgi:hypothetical protein
VQEYDGPEDRQDELPYRRREEIDPSELREALIALPLLGDDMFLRMQAFNLAIVDPFLMQLEADVLRKLLQEERTPLPEAAFLSAQSQMWIFAAYELLRTWRGRVRNIRKWAQNDELGAKRQALELDVGYPHPARKMRAEQIRRVQQDPAVIDRINNALRAVHVPFARLEALRMSMAKHEIKGRPGSVALRPGYGRINQSSGSLDYELENGHYSMGFISRRDIADELRRLAKPGVLPSDESLKQFDEYMRGTGAPSFDAD